MTRSMADDTGLDLEEPREAVSTFAVLQLDAPVDVANTDGDEVRRLWNLATRSS